MVPQQRQRPGVLRDLDRVLAGIDADDVAGAAMLRGVEAGPVVPGLLEGDRVIIVDVEGRLGDLLARGDLGQRLAVDEDLLGVGRHALGGGVGVGRAHRAEPDHVRRRRPGAVGGCPGGGDLRARQDRRRTLRGADGHALVGLDLALPVGSVTHFDGGSVRSRLDGLRNGGVRAVG